MILDERTVRFIQANADGDVRQLAFKRMEGVDMPFALDQIRGRQVARRKLPAWAAVDGMVYPPHLSLEQCSSEATASYKAGLARRLVGEGGGARLVDLTGGFGVDCSFMAKAFAEAVYVERQEGLCELARHNFSLLGLSHVEILCADATDYLRTMPPATLLYIDPARRDAAGGRTFAIADCTPDVCGLLDLLLVKARHVIVKLSPMLDWRKAVDDLARKVCEVHIVSVGGECKELLLVLSAEAQCVERVCCVNDGKVFEIRPESPKATNGSCRRGEPFPSCFLYEPNASLMKSGFFDEVGASFGLCQVARDSHLFFGESLVDGFPGRSFRVEAVASLNKKELKKALAGKLKANVAVRNFPIGVAELRRRLKLSEGGGTYIFATTLASGSHVLLVCSKL